MKTPATPFSLRTPAYVHVDTPRPVRQNLSRVFFTSMQTEMSAHSQELHDVNHQFMTTPERARWTRFNRDPERTRSRNVTEEYSPCPSTDYDMRVPTPTVPDPLQQTPPSPVVAVGNAEPQPRRMLAPRSTMVSTPHVFSCFI